MIATGVGDARNVSISQVTPPRSRAVADSILSRRDTGRCGIPVTSGAARPVRWFSMATAATSGSPACEAGGKSHNTPRKSTEPR